MNKVICIAGMPGAGKSVVADYLSKKGFQFIRFGQVVLDEAIRLGVSGEKEERRIRENLREKHGKAVIATRIIPQIDKLLQKGNVVADGLYSFTEYKEFVKHYDKDTFVLITIYAPPELRYTRISKRKYINDPQKRNRRLTINETIKRDYAEIENLEKGGPIAMADYTLLNTKDRDHLQTQIDDMLAEIVY